MEDKKAQKAEEDAAVMFVLKNAAQTMRQHKQDLGSEMLLALRNHEQRKQGVTKLLETEKAHERTHFDREARRMERDLKKARQEVKDKKMREKHDIQASLREREEWRNESTKRKLEEERLLSTRDHILMEDEYRQSVRQKQNRQKKECEQRDVELRRRHSVKRGTLRAERKAEHKEANFIEAMGRRADAVHASRRQESFAVGRAITAQIQQKAEAKKAEHQRTIEEGRICPAPPCVPQDTGLVTVTKRPKIKTPDYAPVVCCV